MSAEVDLMSAADIARLAGVTRAAISNWRKRYADFPTPVGGSRNALFARPDVEMWLDRHRKASDVSGEVLLWQALRTAYGDDMLHGLADVAEFFVGDKAKLHGSETRELAQELAAESSPAEVVAGLAERFVDSAGRAGSEHVSSLRLVRAVRQFAGPVSGTVFDPACGIGSMLLAFSDDAALVGQEIDESAARLTGCRAALAGHGETEVAIGDSMRADAWRDLRADLVVCDPPVGQPDWGREDLLLDPRWDFGVPTRAEGELAWLQHCYAHTGPGGQVVVVMPTSTAYRRAGRRIRAELVRRGVLTQVVALPAGMATSHALPVHLWMLRRHPTPAEAATVVRMVDLSTYDPHGPLDPAPDHTVDVPLIDLLDESVDLTPGRHVASLRTDYQAELRATRHELVERLMELVRDMPSLDSRSGGVDWTYVRVADLARAGMFEITDGYPTSHSDQLDSDYLDGFLRSAPNIGRSTSGSGSFRFDLRGARVPHMGIEEQRRYGEAFRAITEFEQRLAEIARLGNRAASLARDGLTNGALGPPTD